MIANLFGPDLGIVIVVILVVLLGGSQLPKIARNVGTAGREFRKAQQEAEEDAAREQATKAAAAAQSPVAQQTVAQQPATPPAPQPLPAATAPADSIQLTREQLDALLKEREEQVRRQTGSPSA